MSNVFQLALQATIGHLAQRGGLEQALRALRAPLQSLRRAYKAGHPDFRSDEARLVYALAYHPYHAHAALEILKHFADVLRFDDEVLRVVVFGAGPAPELVALATFLADLHPAVRRLEVDLVDREAGWTETRELTVSATIPRLWGGELAVRHHVLDLTADEDVCEAVRLVQGRDLVFAQALFTELHMVDRNVSFLDALLEHFGPRTVLLASDFSSMKGFADRLVRFEAVTHLRTLRSATASIPTPRAPELRFLYTSEDGLIERRTVKFAARLFCRPGWSQGIVSPEGGTAQGMRSVPDQELAITRAQSFLRERSAPVFLLSGAAGTGKSYIIGRIAALADELDRPLMLLASTGQAARRLAARTGRPVSTVHSALYDHDGRGPGSDERPPQERFALRSDAPPDCVLIIDESSMISDTPPDDPEEADLLFGDGRLLRDVLTYVNSVDGQVFFVGDAQQLPPVNEVQPKALDPDWFAAADIPAVHAELTTVNRQSGHSSILALAAQCRDAVRTGADLPTVDEDFGDEVRILYPYQTPDWLWGEMREGRAVAVTFRHADARRWNEEVRKRSGRSADPEAGDLLVLLGPAPLQGLANGDELTVVALLDRRRLTLREASVTLLKLALAYVSTVGTRVEFECWVVADVLASAPMTRLKAVRQVLWVDFLMRMRDETIKLDSVEFEQRRASDPYLNAMRAMYAYARTCQRAQGGEWDQVICDLRGTQSIRHKRNRHGYTALTRARHCAWLQSWPQSQGLARSARFEAFVVFALAEATQHFGELVRKEQRGADAYVSLRSTDGTDVVINLYQTLRFTVQKPADGRERAALIAKLSAWASQRLREDAAPPDTSLDPLLERMRADAALQGLDLDATAPTEYQVQLELTEGDKSARLRLHHKSSGAIGSEIASGTDGDADLLERLRALIHNPSPAEVS